jgi:iron complex transport system ATP-binding protein
MPKAPVLDIRNVTHSMNGRIIVSSVNWTVQPGEHWAILGPNGSGKTTLLKIACGYVWPNGGGVVYRKGKRLIDLRKLRESIGWVTSSLASQIPAREQVLRTVVSGRLAQIGLVEGPWRMPSEKDYAQAREYLKEMGCERLSEQEFGTLSQGEQQKVLVARARMARPYMIFLDEPCAGMDPGARENFLGSLERLGKQKRVPSLIYVTHHVEEILPIFRRALLLKDGKIVASGSTRRLLKGDVLRELYQVTLKTIEKKGRHWPVGG